MDYSTTVNLPKTDFPMKADLPKREPAMLALWEKERLYEKAVERRLPEKGKKQFILHDGPPYANGNLHLGHALNKILKDIIVRYKTLTGHYAPYVPGWDCHGLPIELQLMKELKVTDKHKVDRPRFRDQAKAFAEKYVAIQREEFKRMGILGDWEHPYLTMDPGYQQTIVDSFLDLEKQGYVYRGKKPVYWCATDETALAEAEVEYENKVDKAIFVAFPTSEPDVFYAIWTTTPWTLPANVAIAYNPKHPYMRLKDPASGRTYILAVERGEEFKKILHSNDAPSEAIDRFPEARHPWIAGRIVPLLKADFVDMETGTGLVHIAPGHGVEDYQLGQQQKPPLPVISPVSDRGLFTDDVPEWKGQHVLKANPMIIEFLKEKGLLLHVEEIAHSYPHCWRCHHPVIFRATEQWFLSVEHERLRDRLLKAIGEVNWIPGYGKNRITGMVETRPDWCLSRQRLWGTEIPCTVNRDPSAEQGSWRSTVDGPRDPDILDVWFESGVSWAAVLEKRPELAYPADMYLEGSDQHRGWFQTSLIPSVALRGQAPFKAVLTHGFVMDGEGRPMSKSLGNVISPQEIIKQYGADVLRLWVGSSDYAGDVRLSPEILKGLTDTYRKVRNTFRYLIGSLSDFDPPAHRVAADRMELLDRWLVSRTTQVIQSCDQLYQNYEFHSAVRLLVDFCSTVLSGFYLDISKDRLYCDAADSLSRRSAQTAIRYAADALLKLWSPVLPFTTEEAWGALGQSSRLALEDFPTPVYGYQPELEDDVKQMLEVRSLVLARLEAARAAGLIKGGLEAQVNLKSPAASMAWMRKWEALWPTVLIVSQVSLEEGGSSLEVDVKRAEGQKCARCWIFKKDVGGQTHWSDLCGRCASVLEDLSKKGKVSV